MPPDRYTQRRITEYLFKENGAVIGNFQIKGLLNRTITGQLFNGTLEFKDQYLSDSKWFAPKFGTLIYDKKTQAFYGTISGSLAIKNWKQLIYTREISIENKAYTFQITRNHDVAVFDKLLTEPVWSCSNPESEQGEFSFSANLNEVVLLATFYVLHQFMELSESAAG